jgi:hypothetical protein
MTTGEEHRRTTEISISVVDGEERRYTTSCRCAIGADHDDPAVLISQFDPRDEEDDEEGESLDVHTAAAIWRSNGEDEDYMFGYSEDELREADDED